MKAVAAAIGLAVVAALTGCTSPHPAAQSPSPPRSTSSSLPTSPGAMSRTPEPAHVVIVVLENHAFGEVLGNPDAPFLNRVAAHSASLTQFYAIRHPSEPNYLALFSGSTQGLSSDACPVRYAGPNLARSLLDAGKTFIGYAEDLPGSGFTGCRNGDYVQRHCPWISFTDLPADVSQPMAWFPSNYASLPTVSFVIPNLQHDMHDGTPAQADHWLREHLSGYADWAASHDSLLVVTADEDDGSAGNQIPAIISGAGVRSGQYGGQYTLYSLLRLLEDMYHLPRLGASADAAPITGIWG